MAAAGPVPLTTTFTPAPACLTQLRQINDTRYVTTISGTTLTFQYVTLGSSNIACLPTGYQPPPSGYFSPAPFCPAGYTRAFNSTITISPVTETQAVCCPPSFNYQSVTGADVFPWYSSNLCSKALPNTGSWATVTTTDRSGSTTSFTTSLRGGVNAIGISIRWQASDLITTTSSKSTATSTSASTNATATATSTAMDAADASSSGLSTGAIAGIVVGLIVALVFLGALGFFIRKREQGRKNQKPLETVPLGIMQPRGHYANLDAQASHMGEMDTAYPRQEMDATPQHYELSGAGPTPREMPGYAWQR